MNHFNVKQTKCLLQNSKVLNLIQKRQNQPSFIHWTLRPVEQGAMEALDSTTVSTNTITYVASFEAGDATGAVTEAAIFNASSSGTMLCRVVFAAINKASADTMSVTWVITLTAS